MKDHQGGTFAGGFKATAPAFAACLQSMLMTMPPSWQAVVVAAPTAPTWQQGLSESGNQLIQNTQTGQCHSLTSHGQLQQSNVQAASAAHPVRVISWDPSRPWRGPTRQPTESASTTLYSQGQLWGPNHMSMGVWGWGQQPAHHRCSGFMPEPFKMCCSLWPFWLVVDITYS